MPEPLKPQALTAGSIIDIVAPSSPVQETRLRRGCDQLVRLGYRPRWDPVVLERDGYFAASAAKRLASLEAALTDAGSQAVVAARGGYGASYLIGHLQGEECQGKSPATRAKLFLGFSDATLLHAYLWQRLGWVTFYGPMAAAGFDGGADVPGGYCSESFERAVTETKHGWSLDLQGEALASGQAEGVLLGGCLTLLQALLGTPWDLDARGAILLLEDRGMKPYQVDRTLMHLELAGKLAGLRGIVLGDFPDCDPPEGDGPTVREVCERLLVPLGIPVVYGVPFGHTKRAMFTLPLGVRVRLDAEGSGKLHVLEPAVS